MHAEGRLVPIQVAADGPEERHWRALDAFYEHFPQAEEAVVVTAAGLRPRSRRSSPRDPRRPYQAAES